MMLLAMLVMSGCATEIKMDNAQRLINHPEFSAAAKAAPNWTREALDTISRLEFEIEKPK